MTERLKGWMMVLQHIIHLFQGQEGEKNRLLEHALTRCTKKFWFRCRKLNQIQSFFFSHWQKIICWGVTGSSSCCQLQSTCHCQQPSTRSYPHTEFFTNLLWRSLAPDGTCPSPQTDYFTRPGTTGQVACGELRERQGLSWGRPTRAVMTNACWHALGLTGAICSRIRFSLNHHSGAFVCLQCLCQTRNGFAIECIILLSGVWMEWFVFKGLCDQHTNFTPDK